MVLIWCNNPPACALLVLVLPSEALVDDLGHVLDCLDIGHSRDEQSLGVLGDLGWRLWPCPRWRWMNLILMALTIITLVGAIDNMKVVGPRPLAALIAFTLIVVVYGNWH